MATTYALDKKPVHEADENASDATTTPNERVRQQTMHHLIP